MRRRIKAEARRTDMSVAETLRRALASTPHPTPSAKKPWMRFAGTLQSRDSGSSRSVHDVVVAGLGRSGGATGGADHRATRRDVGRAAGSPPDDGGAQHAVAGNRPLGIDR